MAVPFVRRRRLFEKLFEPKNLANFIRVGKQARYVTRRNAAISATAFARVRPAIDAALIQSEYVCYGTFAAELGDDFVSRVQCHASRYTLENRKRQRQFAKLN